jgi:hypothetical protein
MAIASVSPAQSAAMLRSAVADALLPIDEALGEPPVELDEVPVGHEVWHLQQETRLLYTARQQRDQLVRDIAGLREERETIRQEVEALVRLGLERRREAAEDVEQLETRARELLVVVNALARQVLCTLDTAAQVSATLEQHEQAPTTDAPREGPATASLQPASNTAVDSPFEPAAVPASQPTPDELRDAVQALPESAPHRGLMATLLRWLGGRSASAAAV